MVFRYRKLLLKDFKMSQKIALVTGAMGGLGTAVCQSLAKDGMKVVANCLPDFDQKEGWLAAQRELGFDFVAAEGDVSNYESCAAMVAQIEAEVGPIDILVNNAGATWGAPAETHPIQAWDKVMNLNVRGYFLLCQQVARRSMLLPREDGQGSRGGRIINIASIAGLGGNPPGMQTVAYNTSKAAVINFTRALACEWGSRGINVNAVCPGFFPSKMTAGLLEKLGADNMAAHAPLRRLGDDEDLKGLTLLFASDAGKHITGQYMAVDGGVSALIGG